MKDKPKIYRRIGFIDSLSDGVIVLSCNKIVDINKTMLDLLDGKREEYIESSFEKYIYTSMTFDSIMGDTNEQENKSFLGKVINHGFDIEFNASRFDKETYILTARRIYNEYNDENLFRWILGVSVEGVIIHDSFL
jgi:hypothetical protein